MARFFLSSSLIVGAMLMGKASAASPTYSNKFSVALPIPEVLAPLTTYTPSSGNPIDFYQINITPFTKQLWPGLAATSLVGYNGMYPGPTIKATKGREIVVRFVNEGDSTAAVHLHGSATVAPFDGWASDTMTVGQYKDYYYPNFQDARTLWYHDHAHLQTASNVQKGQAGMYILDDPDEDYGLPTGDYDIPLVLASKQYNTTGAVLSPENAGDTIEVNGQLWPFLNVEPRKYRFRILNGAATRTFRLQLFVGNTTTGAVGFQVVAADAGYMTGPVSATSLTMSMGERYEIVVDFANYAGQSLKLRDASSLTSDTLGQLMQFTVGSNVSDNTNNGDVPSSLRNITFLEQPSNSSKTFTFAFTGTIWTINGVTFSDVNNRVLHNVPRGTTEIWTLVNTGPAIHPIHVHLVDVQILSRTIGGVAQTIPAYEAASLKDIAILNPQETVTVLAKYAPWDGLYMFHCHNLVHEDDEMMAAFNITALDSFNYTEKTRFIDPVDTRWAPKTYTGTNLTEVLDVTLPAFKALEAYDDIDGLMAALDAFHSTR